MSNLQPHRYDDTPIVTVPTPERLTRREALGRLFTLAAGGALALALPASAQAAAAAPVEPVPGLPDWPMDPLLAVPEKDRRRMILLTKDVMNSLYDLTREVKRWDRDTPEVTGFCLTATMEQERAKQEEIGAAIDVILEQSIEAAGDLGDQPFFWATEIMLWIADHPVEWRAWKDAHPEMKRS